MLFNSFIRRSICNKNKTLMSMLKTLCFHLLKLIVGVYLYNHGPFFISLISHYLTSTRTCETFHDYDWKFLFTRLSGKQIWGSNSSLSMFYSLFSPAPNTTTAISHTHTHKTTTSFFLLRCSDARETSSLKVDQYVWILPLYKEGPTTVRTVLWWGMKLRLTLCKQTPFYVSAALCIMHVIDWSASLLAHAVCRWLM